MSAFSKFMKLFSMAGGVRANVNPVTGALMTLMVGQRNVVADLRLFRGGRKTVVIDGDSISAGGLIQDASAVRWSNLGWWVHAFLLLKWPLRVLAMSAVSGQTSSQILARFASSVAAYSPDEVWAIIGHNNLADADGGAQAISDIISYVDQCRMLGITVRLGTLVPRTASGVSSLSKTNVVAINAAIRGLAAAGKIRLFDPHLALLDPASADSAARAGLHVTGDTIHPNAYGHYLMAVDAVSRWATDFPDDGAAGPFGNNDSLLVNAASKQLVANPKCSGSAGTISTAASGTCATSWLLGRQIGSALTLVGAAAQADGATGGRVWQKMTFSGTVASGTEVARLQQYVSLASLLTPVVPGVTTCMGRCRIKSSGISANIRYVSLLLACIDAAQAVLYTAYGFADSGYGLTALDTREQVIGTPEFVIPAATAQIIVKINAGFDAGVCAGDLYVTDVEALVT